MSPDVFVTYIPGRSIMAAVLQDPCRSSLPDARLSRCGAELRYADSEMDCATRSVCHLLEEVNNREMKDAAANRGVSYRDCELFIAFPRRLFCIRAVHLQCFRKSDSKGLEQLVTRALLAVDAWNLFNPADPPFTILFYDGRVALVHADTSKTNLTSATELPTQ